MPGGRDLAQRLDKVVNDTFDHGGVTFQKMNGPTSVGQAVAIPAESDGASPAVSAPGRASRPNPAGVASRVCAAPRHHDRGERGPPQR